MQLFRSALSLMGSFAAMGWTNTHLYEIRARDVGWGIPDRHRADGPLDARKARLGDVLEDIGAKTLRYL